MWSPFPDLIARIEGAHAGAPLHNRPFPAGHGVHPRESGPDPAVPPAALSIASSSLWHIDRFHGTLDDLERSAASRPSQQRGSRQTGGAACRTVCPESPTALACARDGRSVGRLAIAPDTGTIRLIIGCHRTLFVEEKTNEEA